MAKRFDGEGFSHEPLEGEEAAQVRHLYHVIDDQWIAVSDVITIIRALNILSTIVKIGAPIGIGAWAFGSFAKAQGWL